VERCDRWLAYSRPRPCASTHVGPRRGCISHRRAIGGSGRRDAFDTLGYVADLGAGSFYFLARAVERTGADVSHAGGDYGTRFLATAGVLNLLAALHAYEAARGRKA
jgi:hypothetical protein